MTELVEGCAGLAAVTLRAVAGQVAIPWARPGSKVGYAARILELAGVPAGWRPSRVTWAEPAADCRVMLAAYARRDVMLAAAAWCRRWGAEYSEKAQRRLWEELRAEGAPNEGAADMGREVARVAAVQARTVPQASLQGFGGRSMGNWKPAWRASNGWRQYPDDAPAEKLERIGRARWPAVMLARDVREIEPRSGALLYLDPPYAGTIGYGEGDIGRADVLALAERWRAAGATVVISEAVPLAQDLGSGWSSVDIAGDRRGQVRGGANRGCVSEWVTLSGPVRASARQVGLWGGA